MKKKIEAMIDLTPNRQDIWEQIEEVTKALDKCNRKPWYKRVFSWF